MTIIFKRLKKEKEEKRKEGSKKKNIYIATGNKNSAA